MKRIIHLMSTDDYSGAEKVAIDIINGLKENYELIYVTRKGKINKILEKNNIKYINIPKLSINEIRKIVKEYRPDIIHVHDYKASLMAAFSFVDVPIISHLHNNSPWIKTFHPYSFAFLLGSIRINKIFTVSNSIEKEYVFSKFVSKKIINVKNPVSVKNVVSQVPDVLKKEYDICFCGRLTKQKNPLKFIELVSEIKKTFPEIKAIILGEGKLRNDCENKIKELNLQNNIILKGFVDNPYIYMAKSKIFCLTSDWEGYGLVAFEALALGLPCVVSKVGGLVDIVDEKCGKLCFCQEEFVKEIIKLIKDENYYNKKRKNAIQKANILDNQKKYMNNIKKVYNQLMEDKNEY